MADFSALKTSIQNYIKQNGNEEITGNLLQQILLSMVSTLGDSAINDLVTALNTEIANRGNADTELGGRITTLQGVVNGIKTNVENGYVYAGIATPSTTPVSGKVFYLALTAGTYTNFGSIVVPQGINILKYNGSAWSLDSFLGLDDAPIQGSNNLVKSGGVLDSIIKNGSAFDLSAYNNGTTYADLSAALTALNVLPAAYKKGGMSMKYVQTSDNKYVQWRLMADSFTTDVTQWQGVDDVPTAGSNNLVKSGGVYPTKNATDKLLNSIRTDITFFLSYSYLSSDGKYNFNIGWGDQKVSGFIKADFIYINLSQDGDLPVIAGYSAPNEDSFVSAIYANGTPQQGRFDLNNYYSISGAKYYRITYNSNYNNAPTISAFNIDNKEYVEKEIDESIVFHKNKTNISDIDGSIVSNNYSAQYTSSFIKADYLYIDGMQDTNLVLVAGYSEENVESFVGCTLGIYRPPYVTENKSLYSIPGAKYYRIGFNSNYGDCSVSSFEQVEELLKEDESIEEYQIIDIDTSVFEDRSYLNPQGRICSNVSWTSQYCSTDFIKAEEIYVNIGIDLDRIFLAGYSDRNFESCVGVLYPEGSTTVSGWFSIHGAKYYRVGYNNSLTNGTPVVKIKGDNAVINATKNYCISHDCTNIVPYYSLDENFGTKIGKVLTPSQATGREYMSNMVESPTVWYDVSLNKYVMVHSCYGSSEIGTIGYAYSNDGVTWEEQGQLTIGDVTDVTKTGPVMVVEYGKYYLFYLSSTDSGYEAGSVRLRLVIGNSFNDFINGNISQPTTILTPSNTENEEIWWANAKIYHPCFMKYNNMWYMFINAMDATGVERVGYATSLTLDGAWELQPNPLHELNTIFDNIQALYPNKHFNILMGDPSVFELNGFIIMVFFSAVADAEAQLYTASDYWAYTTKEMFPNGWKYGGISVSPTEGTYDSQYAHKPYIIKNKNKLFHYYTSLGAGHLRSIALIETNIY